MKSVGNYYSELYWSQQRALSCDACSVATHTVKQKLHIISHPKQNLHLFQLHTLQILDQQSQIIIFFIAQKVIHTMSLLQKSSLCRSWLAVGRTSGSILVSFTMYLVRTGHLWQNESGIFPSLRSPRVRTRSISVPKGWNNSRARTPMLYMSDWARNNNTNKVQTDSC